MVWFDTYRVNTGCAVRILGSRCCEVFIYDASSVRASVVFMSCQFLKPKGSGWYYKEDDNKSCRAAVDGLYSKGRDV